VLRQHARREVRGGAGAEADHDVNRTGRIIALRPGRGRQQREQAQHIEKARIIRIARPLLRLC
jgi:hypothetical protein